MYPIGFRQTGNTKLYFLKSVTKEGDLPTKYLISCYDTIILFQIVLSKIVSNRLNLDNVISNRLYK